MHDERSFVSLKGWDTWSRWDVYTWLMVFVALIFQISRLPALPIFMDCYYHLAVMRGFQEAGGWVGHAFWEYVPSGRPHLYPPFFHILEMGVSALGIGPIDVARFFQFLIYPLFLGGMAGFLRSLFSSRVAFFSVFLLSSSVIFYESALILTPFTMAFLLGFLAFWLLERDRWWGASLALALVFYTHTLAGIFFWSSFLLYGFWSKTGRQRALSACVLALIGAAPWLVHLLRHAHYLALVRVAEFYYTQIYALIFLLALAGLVVSWQRQGRYAYIVFLSLSFLPMILIFRNRFFSGQGFILFSVLGAVALDAAWHSWAVRSYPRRVIAGALLVFVFYGLTPVFEMMPGKKPALALRGGWAQDSAQSERLYFPQFMDKVARSMRDNLKPDDAFFSNFTYMGGLLSVLSDRSTTNAMLVEAKSYEEFDPILAARLIVWFKEPEGEFPAGLVSVLARYQLRPLAETEITYLFLNDRARGRRRVVPATVPTGAICLLLGGVLAVIVLEPKLRGRKNKG